MCRKRGSAANTDILLRIGSRITARIGSLTAPWRSSNGRSILYFAEEIVFVLTAELRAISTLAAARHWQSRMMEGLNVPDRRYVGAFRD